MKYTSSFQEYEFRRSVDKALKRIQTILSATRQPCLAHDDENHQYDDKFALVEFLVNTAIAAQLNALEKLGVDSATLKQLLAWAQDEKQSVTLRFHAEDYCSYLKENLVQIQPNVTHELVTTKEKTGVDAMISGLVKESIKPKVMTLIREYHWNIKVTYRIVAFKGTTPDDASTLVLLERSAATVLVISGGQVTPSGNRPNFPISPFPAKTINSPIDVNMSWFLENISPSDIQCQFCIDRHSALATTQCKTPRRNEDAQEALSFMKRLSDWARSIKNFFIRRVIESLLRKHSPATIDPTEERSPSLESINGESLFVPIIPLLENGSVLSVDDVTNLLHEQKRTLLDEIGNLDKTYPPPNAAKLVTSTEAAIMLVLNHIMQLSRHCEIGVDYVEDMLKKQLIKAIGKELKYEDFDTFLKYHNQQLFTPSYAPRPFSYAIRRPEHYPEGLFSIESASGTGTDNEPIQTWVRHVPRPTNGSGSASSISIPIGAAMVVEVQCDCYLHGWMKPAFHDQRDSFQAVARARQFSSFMLVVGTMAGPNRLDPKHAIILQNKDEVIIPLLLETLPSAKAFKEAVLSLSPEQQEFAKAFRSMQLESSVFGVCIIQLKPQLERLLRLPDGALTKEVKLTEDLMMLFLEYQIPSDLLSYNGPEDVSMFDKVQAVKTYVQSLLDVINAEKEKQLLEAEMISKAKEERRIEESQQPEDRFEEHMLIEERALMMAPGSGGSIENLKSLEMRSSLDWLRSGPTTESYDSYKEGRSVLLETAATANEPEIHTSDEGDPASTTYRRISRMDPKRSVLLEDVGNEDMSTLPAFTAIPRTLDKIFEQYDTDNALRSIVIKPNHQRWTFRRQPNLLSPVVSETLVELEITALKTKAFDLLDAISRSGTLPIQAAELHVVVAVSHCFENDIMGSIIQDNINPIAKVEKSSLLIASTILGRPVTTLLGDAGAVQRLTKSFPEILVRKITNQKDS